MRLLCRLRERCAGLAGGVGSRLLSVQAVLVLVVGFSLQWLDGTRRGAVGPREPLAGLGAGAAAAVILTVILGIGPSGVAPFIYFQF